MRQIAAKIYARLLRIEGAYALLTCLAFFATLPMSLAQGYFMLVPGIVSLMTLPIAVLYVVPRLTPEWLAAPQGFKAGAAVLVTHALMPLMVMMTSFSVVLAFAIPEPTSQTVAITLAGLHFLLMGALWWLALVLLVFPAENTPAPRPTALDDPDLTAA